MVFNLNIFNKITIFLITLSSLFCICFSQEHKVNNFSKDNIFVSVSKFDLITDSISSNQNFLLEFKYQHRPNYKNKYFYMEYGANAVFGDELNWGLLANFILRLQTMNNLFLNPYTGWEMQVNNKMHYVNIGASLDYVFKQDEGFIDTYIIGLDFRYPIKVAESEEYHPNIYEHHVPQIELEFGVGF